LQVEQRGGARSGISGSPPMLCPPSFLLISPLFILLCRPSSGYACQRWLTLHSPSPRQRFLWLPQVPLHRHRSSRPRLMAHGIWWHGHRRGLGYLIRRRGWRISAGRRHIGCVDVVYVRERGILGAAGGGEGGLLPAWVLLAWRGWVVYPRQQKYGGSS
jgi:hypothetical protein